MIKKITELRNVGKFENYKSSEISFGKFNGIYSDNGQGKSTLACILRSFTENNPKLIVGRRTLATTGEIVCKIDTDKGFRNFTDSAWDQSDCSILVFDSHFVNQNIYSGMYVGIDHRRRLYQFIIGESAIHLNAQVNAIADSISTINAQINDKKAEINKVIGKEISVEDFVVLPKIENIEEIIKAKAKEVAALADKDTVTRRKLFSKITIPEFSSEKIKTLVNKCLEDISADSERKVKTHISSKLDANGENWIKQGVLYQAQSNDCPFCERKTEGNDLISAYKDYFNEAYIAFKNKVEQHGNAFEKDFNDALSEKIKKVLSDNNSESEFWNKYVAVSLLVEDEKQGDYFPIILEKDVDDFFNWFNKSVTALLDEKFRSPLEVPSKGHDLSQIETKFNEFKRKIDSYNTLVEGQNSIIQHHKATLGTADIETERKSLVRLKLSMARYLEDTHKLSEEYLGLAKVREDLIAKKESARIKLDEETNRIPKGKRAMNPLC